MLILPIAVIAEEDFGVKIPEWKEFAPTAFVDVQEPKGINKFNQTAKYWYQRRIDFEQNLEYCRSQENSGNRLNCYEALKVEQYKQNSEYNARLEAKINNMNGIPGMMNPTDTMIPVGGNNNFINNAMQFMPNEYR